MLPSTLIYTQLCSGIKTGRITRGIPVIMLIAIDYALSVKFSTDKGASGYVTKLFDPEKVLSQTKPVPGE